MDPTQLQPGYRLDRYELLCPLAYGGMASVWLARFGGRLGFERMVVIKMILPQYSQDPRFQEMFLDEARIASKIEHSNVARILDVGEHQENFFIVMEWVDGDSLSKILRAAEQKKQHIPQGVALRIVADAAAGLHAAHELKERDGTPLGVVHRDVSPQNILVANSGSTMIIDFGVAKARDRVSQDTSAGQLKGKIRYMAPEQALGRTIDHRADVWALGAMLYEMFTGNPPYDGPNEVATLHKLTSGARPAPMPRHMPEVLCAVVERALGYDPEQRFSTALELNLALEGAMVEINEPTTPVIVAHYTGQLLADRKAARRRAVDAALEAARRRDAPPSAQQLQQPSSAGASFNTTLPIGPVSGPMLPIPAPPSSTHLMHHHHQSVPGDVPSHPSKASMPSNENGPMSGLGEAPSGATLGSAAMEYPPYPINDEGPRRRRYIAAAILGVSVAAGVVGAVLIISTAVLKQDDSKKSQNATTTTTAAAGTAPAPTSTELDPPADSAGTTTATTTPPPPPTAGGPATTAAPPSTAASTTTPVAAHTDNTQKPPNVGAATGGGGGGGGGGGTHRPPAAPATPKPKPTPTPTSTKPDRGF